MTRCVFRTEISTEEGKKAAEAGKAAIWAQLNKFKKPPKPRPFSREEQIEANRRQAEFLRLRNQIQP